MKNKIKKINKMTSETSVEVELMINGKNYKGILFLTEDEPRYVEVGNKDYVPSREDIELTYHDFECFDGLEQPKAINKLSDELGME